MGTEQEQIDKLAQALTSIYPALGLSIQGHSQPNHLTVFQEDGRNIHQLLIDITYIGKSYPHPGPAECKASTLHLTSCDDDGYCNFCGHRPN